MSKTVLQLVQSACYGAKITPPTALASATDTSVLQLIELFYETGRELLKAGCWSQLKKKHTIFLQSGRSQYQLPLDYYSALPRTHWDQSNRWQMQGPMGDSSWNFRFNGYVTIENRKGFREFGSFNPNDNRGQLEINPIPGDASQNAALTFEYISRSWLCPKHWTSGGTVSASDYVNCSGNIYSHSVGTTNGTNPPNMAYGTGQDGGVFLTYILPTAWNSSTLYGPGDYVTNGGNLYVCKTGGTSDGSGGPTGTTEDTDITDNTVTWRYLPTTAWVGMTTVSSGDIITTGGRYYRATTFGPTSTNAMKTGRVAPTWTSTTVSDGTITWTHYTDVYDSILKDTDLCLFDEELMILGLQWRFMRARGMEYAGLRADYDRFIRAEIGRLNEGKILSAAGGSYGPAAVNPNIPETFSF